MAVDVIVIVDHDHVHLDRAPLLANPGLGGLGSVLS